MTRVRLAAAATVIALSCASSPAVAQAVSPNAAWSCMFASTPTDCGFSLQAAASNRATLVTQARDGNNALELTTQPGDSNLFGSGTSERADLELGPSSSYCNQGQEEWWAHSLLFPDSYVVPPAGAIWNWGVVFDFHHTGPTGQANFQIVSLPTGLEFWIAGGPTVVTGTSDPGFYSLAIGTVVKNQWYDFVYHVKWSSGSDGFFQAWINGQLVLNFSGPTLYVGESCYLKLANYHTPLGVAVSVIHDRIVRGATQADVEIPAAGSNVRTLSLAFAGPGSASVTSNPAGLNCPPACSAGFPTGSTVTLAAVPATSSYVSSWGLPGCQGNASTCAVIMSTDTAATISLALNPVLTVSVGGSGQGSVTSSDRRLNCPGTCVDMLADGTPLTLTAQVSTNSVFSGWSGACSGSQPMCQLTANGNMSAKATFAVSAGTGGGGGTGGAGGPGAMSGSAGGAGALDLLTLISITAGLGARLLHGSLSAGAGRRPPGGRAVPVRR